MEPRPVIPVQETQPNAPDYASTRPRSSWPVALYLVTMTGAFVAMYGYVAASVPYKDERVAQWRTQFALIACAGVRLAWARLRGEQGRGWMFYVGLMAAAPALWVPCAPWMIRVLGR